MAEELTNLSREELLALKTILNKMNLDSPNEGQEDENADSDDTILSPNAITPDKTDTPSPSEEDKVPGDEAEEYETEDSPAEPADDSETPDESSSLDGNESQEEGLSESEDEPEAEEPETQESLENDDLEDFVDEEGIDSEEIVIPSDSNEDEEPEYDDSDPEEDESEETESEEEDTLSSTKAQRRKSKKKVRNPDGPPSAKERRKKMREMKKERERKDREETVEKVSLAEVEERLIEVVGDEGEIAPFTWSIVPPEDKYDVPLLVFSQDDEDVFSLALTEKTARSLRSTVDSALYYYMSERQEIRRRNERKKYEKLSPPKKAAVSTLNFYQRLRLKYGRLAIFGAVTISAGFLLVVGVSLWTMIVNSDIFYMFTK